MKLSLIRARSCGYPLVSVGVMVALLGLASPRALGAQTREKDIPASSRPPAGMCRIWLDDVPAKQQPAPTDCASAVRNRPAKGRVIFGDDYVAPKKSDSTKVKQAIKGFAPAKSSKSSPPPRKPLIRIP